MLIDRVRVGVSGKIIGDAGFVGACGRVRIGDRMDEVGLPLFGQLVDEIAGADARPVRGNDGRLVPAPFA